MMVTLDMGVHILEALAIMFWIGKSWGDLQWLKSELTHLRDLCETNFNIRIKQ